MVGLAASLAVQDSLSNLASGIMILVTKPFKIGDYVDFIAGTSTGALIASLLLSPSTENPKRAKDHPHGKPCGLCFFRRKWRGKTSHRDFEKQRAQTVA